MTYRKLYNKAIINKLQEIVEKYPDWRFGQILRNCDVVKETLIQPDSLVWKDEFNVESKTIWERMCNNIYCFEQK